jgi:hypothetical protein
MGGTTPSHLDYRSRKERKMNKSWSGQSAWRVLLFAVLVAVPVAAGAQNMPSAQVLQRAVQEGHAKFKDVKDGAPADYIPELTKVPAELFGVAIVTARGDVYTAVDVYTRQCSIGVTANRLTAPEARIMENRFRAVWAA